MGIFSKEKPELLPKDLLSDLESGDRSEVHLEAIKNPVVKSVFPYMRQFHGNISPVSSFFNTSQIQQQQALMNEYERQRQQQQDARYSYLQSMMIG